MKLKIGILIPTRGDRPKLLEFARQQIKRQTMQPHVVLVIDEKPKSNAPDITYRYRTGCLELEKRGCDLFIFWEDDDWYHKDYIKIMVNAWLDKGRPELMGVGSTYYYNINNQKYKLLIHPVRASMMSTMATQAINKIEWCEDSYSFTDMFLWTKSGLRKWVLNVPNEKPICIGIKHGTGLCGGGGHDLKWAHFDQQDYNFKWLNGKIPKEDLQFYSQMADRNKYKIIKYQMSPNPFLTIVTRVMLGKRNGLFRKHKESVSLLSPDFQQIYIGDQIGYGMLAANTSFGLVTEDIKGKYIYLLDDDDFIVNKNFIQELRKVDGEPDVIFFRMKILTGDGDEIYPKPGSWKQREQKRAQIGGSCFVVKKWVYEKYIHNFAYQSFGDWNFITAVMADENVKAKWIDIMMAETGKVSRGSAE